LRRHSGGRSADDRTRDVVASGGGMRLAQFIGQRRRYGAGAGLPGVIGESVPNPTLRNVHERRRRFVGGPKFVDGVPGRKVA
jgi:hypothetical protein